MQRRVVVLVAGLLLGMAGPGPVRGQIAWETPMLIGPGAPGGFGIHLMEPWPGNGLGVLGTYRTSPVPVGLGFRIGLGEDRRDDLSVFGGVDVAGFLVRSSGDQPLDVLWFAGAGIGIGDDALLSFPLGLSIGADLRADNVIFRPYVAPRVVLDACLGDRCRPGLREDDNLDLDIAVDLGLDLSFAPTWTIRFAATLGDRDALLIGVAFPM